MIISVTAEDIAEGTPGDCESCPVQIAICRTLGLPSRDVNVDGFILTICGDRYRAPTPVNSFIEYYDEHETGEPFTFELTDGTDY